MRPIHLFRAVGVVLLALFNLHLPPLTCAADPEAASVAVAPVRERQMTNLIEVVGTLQAVERAAIAARISGVITRLPVALGTTVQAGETLAIISAEEIAARLQQAEAQLAQAQRTLEREQNLLQKNAATPESVKALQEQFSIAQAGHREANALAGYTTITAPFAGVVTRKQVNRGDLVTPGVVLMHLENPRTLQVSAAIPEHLPLTVGHVLTVQVAALGTEVKGTVAEISPAADPQTRTLPVLIDLPPQPSLRSGQFVRVLVPGKPATTLAIPAAALVPSGQMDRVFVAENGHARLRLVRTGARHDDTIEILAGLGPGELVVTTNNRLLIDGQALRIQP